jgi:protein-disulfide isomerase
MMTTAQRMIVLLLGLVLTTSLAYAELEKTLVNSQTLDKAPLDIAQSVADGRLFVLLAGGEVQIFAVDGQQQERFSVGDDVTSLEVSPDGQMLYLGSTKSKALQFVYLSYVQELPVNNSAVKGAENAPVTMTLFDDFECPYCARLVPTLEQVMAAYPQQVRLVYKHFPLSMHKFANSAAIASLAARNQGKFWPLHDELFANYNNLSEIKIRQLAESVGLDMKRFDQDIANPALQQEVAADTQLGTKAGVRGTPAVYINGIQLKDRSFSGFKQAIDAELQKAAK